VKLGISNTLNKLGFFNVFRDLGSELQQLRLPLFWGGLRGIPLHTLESDTQSQEVSWTQPELARLRTRGSYQISKFECAMQIRI